MSLRRTAPTVMLATVVLATTGCAQPEGGDFERTGSDLTTPVVFAAVASVAAGPCPADRPNVYESRIGGVQCISVDPDGVVTAEAGSVSLVAASEQTPDVPQSIELVLEGGASEHLRVLTAALSEQSPPRDQMVIAVEGEVVAMPTVMAELSGGTVGISGEGLKALYRRLTA
ncbi:hypothetical protein [Leucobacter ruminantium]|uniref:Preprotein translocase subunit SecD n=1 Tax=Leucobacter ruminantium TaxID=1289170 RepID=A0A939LUZ6_9MICO|nr:hypothetical protein [Leucobacter ruminantium]MBO1805304.1 hypothetical protein [Leucobacter ruminantium]